MNKNSWNSLEEEFLYYAQVLHWAKLFNVIASKTKVIKEVDIFSAIEGIGLGLLVKGDAYKFLSTISGKTGEDAAEWLKNEIRCFNAQRTAQAIAKCYKFLKDSGIEAKSVPLKLLMPTLENISIEDDEGLRERWENLLISEASGEEVHPDNIEILKSLTSNDAKILDTIFEIALEGIKINGDIQCKDIKERLESRNINLSDEKLEESLERFIGKQLCEQVSIIGYGSSRVNQFSLRGSIYLTKVGASFMKAITNTQINE